MNSNHFLKNEMRPIATIGAGVTLPAAAFYPKVVNGLKVKPVAMFMDDLILSAANAWLRARTRPMVCGWTV
jgi:hypothetical protein